MTRTIWIGLVELCISLALCGPMQAAEATTKARHQFRVFDATLYMNKPDLSKLGIDKIPVIYSGVLWDRNESRVDLPREDRVAAISREISSSDPNKPAVIDIEHWPWVEHKGDVSLGMKKFITVLEWFKKYAPSLSFGYYAVPPVPDFDSGYADKTTERFYRWQKQNNQLAQLAHASQVLFPSLYSFSPNREHWIKSAAAHIQEARRYGTEVPVFVFLWPQYHEITRGHALEFIDREFWRIQLETAMKHADGIVIWGGWDIKKNKAMLWDDNAPWWLETRSFLSSMP